MCWSARLTSTVCVCLTGVHWDRKEVHFQWGYKSWLYSIKRRRIDNTFKKHISLQFAVLFHCMNQVLILLTGCYWYVNTVEENRTTRNKGVAIGNFRGKAIWGFSFVNTGHYKVVLLYYKVLPNFILKQHVSIWFIKFIVFGQQQLVSAEKFLAIATTTGKVL